MEQRAILYRPDIAIELASSVPGLIPVRLFALLYPLWLVEIDAHEEAKRPYALIEQFIERGIQEGHLHTVEEMVDFFGLSTSLVIKVLHFLTTIQHVHQVDGRWSLTERGAQSLSQGIKSVKQAKGQHLYFDGFCSMPLLQDHYHKRLQIISDLEAESTARTAAGGYRFYRLPFSGMWDIKALNDLLPFSGMWDIKALNDLVNNPDRARYNLPQESRAITVTNCAPVYMPMYIVEAKKPRLNQPYYLVYTHIKDQRDAFFEHIVNKTLAIQRRLDAMPKEENLAEIWSKWLRSRDLAYLRPELTPAGLWRVALPETLFQASEHPLWKIGTYYKEKGYFLQIWCNNDSFRRKAACDHTLHIIIKRHKTLKQEYVEGLLQQWSELLEVPPLHMRELHSWARKCKVEDALLQKLSAWC